MAKIPDEVQQQAIAGIRGIYKDDPIRAEHEVNQFRLICQLGEPPFTPQAPWWRRWFTKRTTTS